MKSRDLAIQTIPGAQNQQKYVSLIMFTEAPDQPPRAAAMLSSGNGLLWPMGAMCVCRPLRPSSDTIIVTNQS